SPAAPARPVLLDDVPLRPQQGRADAGRPPRARADLRGAGSQAHPARDVVAAFALEGRAQTGGRRGDLAGVGLVSDVLALPFDQYQRYRLVADLLKSVRGKGPPLTVLDVGGRTAVLRDFLPDARITL